MIESWRWYGEFDTISLSEVAQTGTRDIVTALHDIPYGEVWPVDSIAARKRLIQKAGFEWNVVESLPVHERIKRGEGDLAQLFANYRQSMANLASEGVKTICYNFMPLLDWTRTDLAAPVSNGATCLRFDAVKMAAFEIHMLGRRAAEDDYPEGVRHRAAAWFQQATENDRDALLAAIMAGLPGAFERYDVTGLRNALNSCAGMDRAALRANYHRFLQEVVPTAEELGMRLCVHQDDPPRDILGLPRIVSTGDDLDWVLNAYDSPANGVTFCAGSLGANPANDVPAIAAKVAKRIHFVHLRNVRKDPNGSFEEAAHLDGDTDMVALVRVILQEEARRRDTGRSDHNIPFRPDHGHHMLSDLTRDLIPGYPLIGRLKGLAELRGVIRALSS
ncbi:mannonate dehydratase [Parasedimentitalea huanghaiensis]|uniref:Mannonate dehydratase n=1 Tax=Parasedimentitalea huanghaiensis TaxID=2682100 RepID=A0A6L6WL56_9RHOB|nr:mannonate dehydratase [Zongyanglinia huanghaiensis]MVO18080.1 mannonate dehydratase [Zongyanglinia huanghaiensis]